MGRCHLVAALAVVMLLPAARPGEKVVKPTKNLITGLVDGEGLDQLIPPAHFITKKEGFEKLWKAWLLDCRRPRWTSRRIWWSSPRPPKAPSQRHGSRKGQKPGR